LAVQGQGRARLQEPARSRTRFRKLTSTVELCSVFHRIEPRLRAHVMLCWLALLLLEVLIEDGS
jgi:hypothetical protein